MRHPLPPSVRTGLILGLLDINASGCLFARPKLHFLITIIIIKMYAYLTQTKFFFLPQCCFNLLKPKGRGAHGYGGCWRFMRKYEVRSTSFQVVLWVRLQGEDICAKCEMKTEQRCGGETRQLVRGSPSDAHGCSPMKPF